MGEYISIKVIMGIVVVLMGLRDAFVNAQKKKADAARAAERARIGPSKGMGKAAPAPTHRNEWYDDEEEKDDEEGVEDEEVHAYKPVPKSETPPPRPVVIEGPIRPLKIEVPRVEAPPRHVVIVPPKRPGPVPMPLGLPMPIPMIRTQPPAPPVMPMFPPTVRRDAGRPRRGIPIDIRSARQAVIYQAVFGTPRGLDKDW